MKYDKKLIEEKFIEEMTTHLKSTFYKEEALTENVFYAVAKNMYLNSKSRDLTYLHLLQEIVEKAYAKYQLNKLVGVPYDLT